MTTGFGSCANCGTPRVSPQQTACNVCGAAFPAAPMWSKPEQTAWQAPDQQQPPPVWQPPVQPQPQLQAWQQAPAPQPAQPQAWQPQPAQQDWSAGYPQGYPGYAPARSSNKGMIAAVVGGAGVVLVLAIIFAVVLISGGGSKGGITFSPATIACNSTQTVTSTVRLPSSVSGSTVISFYNDGTIESTFQVNSKFSQQSDGTWMFTEVESTGTFTCDSTGGTSVGTHNVTVKDASGNILGTGTYTVTP
ncbi:MAG TPA: hypothetical protein VF375_07930 [Candidatus Limnocylindrales bacterium]